MAQPSVDILLVGKTGHGKSATANSIVGNKVFRSITSTTSVTKSAQIEFVEFEGRKLKIVDGPGIVDTCSDTEEAGKLVVDAMTVAVAASPAGFHAIVVVARVDVRCSQEEVEAVRLLKEIFGANFITDHGILLMTHGDIFLNRDEENKESFEEWIRQQKGEIQDLLKECNGRVILFNNRADANENKEQIRKLLAIVDQLSGNGQRYTSKIFEEAKETRDRLLRDSKRIQLSDESLMECALVTQEISHVNYDEPKITVSKLGSLSTRTDTLRQIIKQEDKGTKQLSGAITLAKQLHDTIEEQTKDAKEILKLKERIAMTDAELQIKSMRLEDEEKKRKEEEFKHQKDIEKQIAKNEKIKKKLEQEKEKNERIIKEKEEKQQKQQEKIQEKCQEVKQEESWTWGGVAGSLVGPLTSAVKLWYGK